MRYRRQFEPRNKPLIFVVVAVMALMIAGVLWYRLARQGTAKQQVEAKWTLALNSQITAPIALADDGTLMAATEDGWLYAISPGGRVAWRFQIGPTVGAPSVGEDGTVYVENKEQQVFAIAADGAQKWTTAGRRGARRNLHGDSVWRAGALDGVFYYTFAGDAVQAFSVSTGAAQWAADDGFQMAGAVAVSPSGSVLYPGNGRVDAVDFLGKSVWRYPALGTPYFEAVRANRGRPPDGGLWLDSPIAVNSDGTMYATAELERFVALNPDGSLKWEFMARGSGRSIQSPVIARDGTIFFACSDGTLYAINPDGTKKWAVPTGSSIAVSPILADDGTILLANQSGVLMVSPEGKLSRLSSTNVLLVSSLALGPDGTLYVAYKPGGIKAFRMPHGGLMKSAWPKFQHDLRNTGRAAS